MDLQALAEWVTAPTMEQRRRLRHFAARRERYGRALVPKPQVYEILTSVVDPVGLGLTAIGPRTWARRRDHEHVSVLWFRSMKGGSVQVAWGTSASYVPVALTPKVRWARTLKQATAVLWTCGREIEPGRDPWPIDGGVHTSNGPVAVADDINAIWAVVRDRVEAFWATTASPEGLLAAAREQADNPYHHGPQPAVTAAFAAGRLGDYEGARVLLTAARLSDDERAVAEALGNDLHNQSWDEIRG
ncbi:hypothetical protein GCM10009682_41070 [Luedemannella flava]|uniref:DUF4304 domain-containing protein n=1 Tax=Luedemannella flava TaxID=349316 RepID=A0ABP4YGC9_9ACTN